MEFASHPTISSHCFFLVSGTVKNIRSGWSELEALHDGTIHVLDFSDGIFKRLQLLFVLYYFDKCYDSQQGKILTL